MKLKDVVKDFDKAVNTEEEEVEIEETEKSDKVEAEAEEVDEEVKEDEVEKSDEDEVEKSDEKEEDEEKEETEEEKKKRKKKEKKDKEKKKSEEDKEDKEDKEDDAEKSVEEAEESEEVFKNEDMVGFLQSVLKSYENTREELVSVKEELEAIKGLFTKEGVVDAVNKSSLTISEDQLEINVGGEIVLEGETAIEKSEKSEEEVVEKAETTAPKTEEVDGVAKSEDGEDIKEGFATKNATNVDNLEEAVKSEEVSKTDDESDEALVEEIEKNFMEKFQNDIRDNKVSKNDQYELRRAYIDMKNGQVEGNVDKLVGYLEE